MAGPEHELHAETGYIDARPQSPNSKIPLATHGRSIHWVAAATCGTIRLKLLKIGALVRVTVRRIKIALASACPYAHEFALAHARLRRRSA